MQKIIVVMGGPSAEYEVSLSTGREMLTYLDRSRYQPRIVLLTHEKTFYYSDASLEQLNDNDLFEPSRAASFIGPILPAQSHEIWNGFSLALLALHGEFGEDGQFQGFLETIGMPYTGSNVFSSAVGMEKIASKHLFEQQGITTPPHSVYTSRPGGPTVADIAATHGFPCFVKCPQSGSSRLLGRADTLDSLEALIGEFARYSSQLLIETLIVGDEYTVPVIEHPDGSVQPLPPILIRPKHAAFFDYTAKYTAGECEEIVPAPCSDALKERLRDVALKAHTVLQCRGLSRTDMIVRDDQLYVLETNTLPGLTSNSLVPKSFAATGGTYSQLLDILIETRLNRAT